MKFYAIDLIQFKSFLSSGGFPDRVNLLDKNCFKAYLKELYCWKPKTIKRKIATVKAFFNYLEFEDVIAVNPLRKIRMRIKEPLLLPKALTKRETDQLLKSVYHALQAVGTGSYAKKEKTRDVLVIELLYATGARVSEISNLKIKDINRSSGQLMIYGKGKKERMAHICNPATMEIINTYMDYYPDQHGDAFLLINRFGNKLSDQSIRNLVKRVTLNSKLEKHVTPHVFRHTFATLLLENDVDIKYIQSMLGHSSITTTQIYTQVNREKEKQILTEKHPRHEFSIAVI